MRGNLVGLSLKRKFTRVHAFILFLSPLYIWNQLFVTSLITQPSPTTPSMLRPLGQPRLIPFQHTWKVQQSVSLSKKCKARVWEETANIFFQANIGVIGVELKKTKIQRAWWSQFLKGTFRMTGNTFVEGRSLSANSADPSFTSPKSPGWLFNS